jgi:hypothetical protein
MPKKCAICDILLDVLCGNPACDGHHNESIGDVCGYCATNERENMRSLRRAPHLLVSSLADTGTEWTEHEERSLLEI